MPDWIADVKEKRSAAALSERDWSSFGVQFTDDDRPLIIDQPEENLDPESVFDELVPVFREAKKRRQIIIVTHNANLVVNTDVDWVVVAQCGPHRPGQLPEISYQSGGLENPSIRSAVCAILEGGERAFHERARCLRVAL